jgi:hypothetical protein
VSALLPQPAQSCCTGFDRSVFTIRSREYDSLAGPPDFDAKRLARNAAAVAAPPTINSFFIFRGSLLGVFSLRHAPSSIPLGAGDA